MSSSVRRTRVRPSIVAIPAWLVLALASTATSTTSTYAVDAAGVEFIPRRAIADAFQTYDGDAEQLDHKACRDDLEHALCPSIDEEAIACSGLEAVEKYCSRILGEESVQDSGADVDGAQEEEEEKEATTTRNLAAVEGCKNYVSWDDDRLSCCPSNHCFEVTGEHLWGEWELVDEAELDFEDEEFEYEYANELYEEDRSGSLDDDDEDADLDDDEDYGYDDEVEDVINSDSEDQDEVDSSREASSDNDTRRLDATLKKIPFVGQVQQASA